MKAFFLKYKHIVPLLIYAPIYMIWFSHLERTVKHYKLIHVALDDYIPFCEVFIVPYLLWFVFIAAVMLYFFFTDVEGFYRLAKLMFTGMTIFLIVSTLVPNGLNIRPYVFERDNIFVDMVKLLYRADTPTNVMPSIHVYNSIGAHLAIVHNQKLARNKKLHISSLVLCISIILSTVFIKQHSMFDVLTAFVLSAVMYVIVYQADVISSYRAHRSETKRRRLRGA